jgi:hypothetical protein
MTKQMIYGFSVILLAAASAKAEQAVAAQIPFPFHVGDSALPAGSYIVDTGPAAGVLRVRSDDGKSTVMILATRRQSATIPEQSKLVFHKYGDDYFLSQVWTGGSNSGRELRESRREIELAAAAQRGTQTILARK